MTPGRLWWLAQRDFHRGFQATWNDYRVCDRLLEKPVPFGEDRPTERVPVLLLTGGKDFRCALWTLASWFHFTGRNWQLIIHDDGSLTPEHEVQLRSLFPHSKIIWRREADKIMANAMTGLEGVQRYRKAHVLALKAFDMPALVQSPRMIVLDSDLLFFQKPREVLSWVDADDGSLWFNRDVKEANGLSSEEIFSRYHFRLWPQVNSGLCLLQTEAFNLAAMNTWLTETTLLQGNLWIVEQTLLAMAASRAGKGGLLPPQYEVSLGRWSSTDCIMRHYVGAVRQRFFGEGLARLGPVLLKGRG